MKFLFVLYIGFDKHGPSVHLLTDMIEQCLIKGHSVEMIVRNRGGNFPDVPEKLQKYDNLTCYVIHDKVLEKGALVKRYFEDIMYSFKCKKIYEKISGIDAVFLQSCTSPLFPILLLKHTLKKPILFNVQNIFPNDALVLGKLSKRGIKGFAYRIFIAMQRAAYKKSDRIVTISEDMKQTLVAEKADENKIDVIYNWSYTDDFLDIHDDENLFLNAHPEVKDKFRVVFAGNLGAMVDAQMIASVAEKLSNIEDILFIIIGDGNNMEYLKNTAKQKGLKNMLFFPYQLEEFARHNYAMADININALPKGIIYTCMPSKTATMLNSVRPIVVSVEKNSCYAKLMQEVDKCFVVDNVNDYADAIMYLYNNGRRGVSLNSRDVFISHCSCKNACEYVKVLEGLVKE